MDHAASKVYHIDGWGGFEKPPPDAQIQASSERPHIVGLFCREQAVPYRRVGRA
jgi:hypothetical protein